MSKDCEIGVEADSVTATVMMKTDKKSSGKLQGSREQSPTPRF